MVLNKMDYFDTNIILRFLLKDNETQYLDVIKKLDEIRKKSGFAVVLGEVVAECVYVMEKIYKIPRQDIGESLVKFLKSSSVYCVEKDVLVSTLNDYSVINLAYVDILLIQMVKKRGGKIFSFDKKLLAKSK